MRRFFSLLLMCIGLWLFLYFQDPYFRVLGLVFAFIGVKIGRKLRK